MLGWRQFVRVVLGAFSAIMALLAVSVLLMNPYGNLPQLLFSEHVITDVNQRFQYPALIRSQRFDSIVVGASDARLLNPVALERVLGGRFANLAMNAGHAWEQYRLVDLFLRKTPHPRTLLIGLDHVWCDNDAGEKRTTFRGFPDWMYDDNPWNDLAFMLNGKSVELSVRRLGNALGVSAARFQAGYEVFTPAESAYDPVKVRNKLWGRDGPHAIAGVSPPYVPAAEERLGWQFPALVWLDEIMSRFPGRVILAFMPAHIAAQPVPGSQGAARESECKSRIGELARRYQAPLIDFRIRSTITATDGNYWDRLHYRLGIAERIVADIQRALETGKDDPNGDWRYLDGPSVAAMSSTP